MKDFYLALGIAMSAQNIYAHFDSLEDEYTPEYILALEAAYGEGMMSDGGDLAIESMFKALKDSLPGKKALDIGSGLGGVAFYLSHNYKMDITGIEVNPWLVEESSKRIPSVIKDQVRFILTKSNSHWPISEKSMDIVYSKGVLVQVKDKDEVFQEAHRLLKDSGYFLINDWLSSDEKKWGPQIERLIALEHLTLYPDNLSSYIQNLQRNGFEVMSVKNVSEEYAEYNRKHIQHLYSLKQADFDIIEAIEGYESIVTAFKTGELRSVSFLAKKKEF